MSKLVDVTGLRFGRLRVLHRADNTRQGAARWLSICDCGRTTNSTGYNLTSGTTLSCGCLAREKIKASTTKHGGWNTPVYNIWRAMVDRCTKPHCQLYSRYGARGIEVCEAWARDFSAFRDDMGPRPRGHSLERVDNNGNYEPKNVIWATAKVQNNNKRTSHVIEYRGQPMTVAQACQLAGMVCDGTAGSRIRSGWPIDLAIETPPTR